MSRIDLVKFRKFNGLSQRKLAEILDIKPSFLSAIENGRSRLPEDKLDKLKSAFGEEILTEYYEEEPTPAVVPPHSHTHDESDSIAMLLNHFHDLAHRKSNSSMDKEKALTERIDFLNQRNDRLSSRLDDLRDEIDALRNENIRLKELLLKNGIPYSD